MQVRQKDYMTQLLRLYLPGAVEHWGQLSAAVEITQPCGYHTEMEGRVTRQGKWAEIEIRYPLMDDGAWEQVEGYCKAFDFEMGHYTFALRLRSDGHPIVTEELTFDQDQLYASSWKTRIRTDFPPGFIECAPLRPICIDQDEVPVWIRLRTERVPHCRVRMDVVVRGGREALVEPVELDLAAAGRTISFAHADWERGEYWVRVQVLEEGRPVGPCMVRKFWKEVIGPEPRPEPPLRLGTAVQYMVDGWLFESSEGLDFWPVSYDPDPDQPAIRMDRPWEYGIMAVRRYGNVFADLAGGAPTAGLTELAVQELGAERVIYGSDAPGRSFASQLAKVHGARISEQAKALVLGGNIERLLPAD